MIKRITSAIPNTITLLNLLSGIVAIIFSFSPMDHTGGLTGWEWASLMIGIAAVFDFLDGAAARILNARSEIGKELDSLADLVSFGVAPALILLNILKLTDAGIFCYAPLFLPLMGALRLARFNIDNSQTTSFKGLPIPANAIFWIGVAGAMCNGQLAPPLNLTVLAIMLVGLLMVSRLRMFSLKFHNFALSGNISRFIIIIAAIIFVILFGLAGLAMTILLYIIMSLAQAIVKIER